VVKYFEAEKHYHKTLMPQPGLPSNVKTVVVKLFDGGITKPKRILAELRRLDIQEPTYSQLRNFLKYRKTKQLPSIVSLGQLAELCDALKQQESLDAPFVVATEFDVKGEELAFRFFMSTPRLLALAGRAESLQADATYKLIWEGNRNTK